MADDDYIGGRVVAATVFGLLLPITAIAVRVFVKARSTVDPRTRTEDWLAYAALFFKIGLDIDGIILLNNGMGAHVTKASPSNLVVFAKTQYSGNYIYTACIACVKLSILCQYHRILGSAARTYFRWQVRALMAIVILWTIIIFMLSATFCIPLERFWNPQVPGGCLSITDFYYGMQIPNIVTDIFIVVCPTYEVYKQYFRDGNGFGRSRSSGIAALAMMFTLGFVTFIFDIVRLAAFVEVDKSSPDVTYKYVDPAVWTTIEPAIAIVAICLPSFRKLYLMLRQHKDGSDRGEELQESGTVEGSFEKVTGISEESQTATTVSQHSRSQVVDYA